VAASGSAGNGPLKTFCAELRELQAASGLNVAALARKLNQDSHTIGKSQLYEILKGEIKTPPAWETVEPIVGACTRRDSVVIQQWRRRHDIMVGVWEELELQSKSGGPPGAQSAPTRVVRTLRPDTAAFTGRADQLDIISSALTGPPSSPPARAVYVIDGMPGVGKTALAVHAGHLLADHFPDGQMLVDLYGYSADHQPADPAEVLAGLLRDAGTQPEDIPEKEQERAALWRQKTAGQRLLIILDNAAGSDQVAPLLPASADCLVLVTSRSRLLKLGREYGVRSLPLGTLPEQEAVTLFDRVSGRPPGADQAAIVSLVRACGHLPLAITILAAALDTGVTARDLLDDLDTADDSGTAQDRLAAIDDQRGEQDIGVAGAFELSYRGLPADHQRLLRLLSVSPAADADPYAAAALTGRPVATVRRQLGRLYLHRLVDQPIHGRYRLHDLLTIYIRARTPAAQSGPAIRRLLTYYQRVAELADSYLAQHSRAPMTTAAQARRDRSALPDLPGRPEAQAWLTVERANLLACAGYARTSRLHARVVGLAAATASYLRGTGPWALAAGLQLAALASARHLGDRASEAAALYDLGLVRYLAEDYAGAARVLEQALEICRGLGDQLGEANALNQLGTVSRVTGDRFRAGETLLQALEIYCRVGDLLGEANALNQLGAMDYLTDDYSSAGARLQQALEIYHGIGNQLGEANALTYLGAVKDAAGEYPAAVSALQQALELYRGMGDERGEANVLNQLGAALQLALDIYRGMGNQISEANALNRLGAVLLMTGDLTEATDLLSDALDIFRSLSNRLGQADVLGDLGAAQLLTGDFPAAAASLAQALQIFQDLPDRLGEAQVLNRTGNLHYAQKELPEAQVCHQRALQIAQSIPSDLEKARALEGMGNCARTAGDEAGAMKDLRRALEIYQRIGTADAVRLAAELPADRPS